MITRSLTRFAVTAEPAEDALAMMRLSLFDWAVCALAGRDEPVARIVRRMVLDEAGRGDCTLLGSPERAPARGAALVNGATSHALDYDDTHFDHIGHPSVAMIPAALALAEREGAAGGAFLRACTIGAELSVRVGRWLGRGHYDAGFHQTATAGAFGATAAAARVLGLDADRTAHALGIAATRAAGLKSQFGTMGKPYAAGMAAATGVEAALLAAGGFVSRPDGLECVQGFGATHAGTADAAALDGLGETWDFERVTHKFHACCHGTHAPIEALRTLAPQVRGREIPQVTLIVHPSWLRVCDLKAPTTGLEAKFSLTLAAAIALDGQDTARPETFTDATCAVPRLVALRDRVTVETDPDLPVTAARAVVTLTDRETLRAAHDLTAPMALAERAERLRGKADALLGAAAGPLWEAITAGSQPDLPALLACLGEQPQAPAGTGA